MIHLRSVRVLVFGLLLVLAAGVPTAARAEGPAPSEPKTSTPIKHFISLMQENHTFDNYFGTYPGADGIQPNTCMPYDIYADPGSPCVKPFHITDSIPIFDPDHSQATAETQFNAGKMDGFVYALSIKGQNGSLAMGYYDGTDLPYYWNLADNYVLFDRMFSPAQDGSFINHVYWVAGRPFPRPLPNGVTPDVPTIFDRLEAQGISWKFYVQNYDASVNYRTSAQVELVNPNRVSQIIWVPLLNLDRFLDNPKLASHIVDLSEYFTDLQNGTLPAVSYIIPSGASEHPPGNVQSGEKFVRGLIQELMRSTSWSSSAFMITYDDWGGWYDHVPPPQVDDYGYGFRVPGLLVSPYARKGYIDHTQYDFTSMLKFVENNWGVAPLADRDANANDIVRAFDFAKPPRPPEYISDTRTPTSTPTTKLPLVYGLYGGVMFMAVLFIFRALYSAQVTRLKNGRVREARND